MHLHLHLKIGISSPIMKNVFFARLSQGLIVQFDVMLDDSTILAHEFELNTYT